MSNYFIIFGGLGFIIGICAFVLYKVYQSHSQFEVPVEVFKDTGNRHMPTEDRNKLLATMFSALKTEFFSCMYYLKTNEVLPYELFPHLKNANNALTYELLGEIVKNLESLEESKRYSALTVGILKEKLIKVIHYQLLDKDKDPFLLYIIEEK